MYPILGRYGPFFLYSYTVVMGLGLAAGIGLTAWFVKKEEKPDSGLDSSLESGPYPGWLDGLLVSLAAAVLGGRVGFVWANASYFQERPDEITLVWQGGLSYHGALVCGLAAFWLWSLWQRRRGRSRVSFIKYAALLMPGFILAHLFGWAACWLEGSAFGRETVIGWFSAALPDSYGVFAVRYQSQLVAFMLTAVVFALSLLLRKRLQPGQYLWLTFGLLNAAFGVVTLLRDDSMPMVGSFRLDTIISFGLVFLSLFGFLLQLREK